MYKSCKLANKSRRGEEKENKLMKEEEIGGGGAGKARVEACCQFQTNHFMYIPSSSS